MKRKKDKKPKSTMQKIWYFIWYDDSILSWIVNVILAFLIVKFVFYPLLSLTLGTSLPLVAVTSPSMEHRPMIENNMNVMCGVPTQETGRQNIDDWWSTCGPWYEENKNITLQDFRNFPLRNGFNKGDIILLRSPRNLEVGDVIVFESGKKYPIIHRTVKITDDAIMTKGDNNAGLIRDSELDETNIQREALLGKAYARIPYLGYIKIWFTDFINLFMSSEEGVVV